jgi:hypothetical protein
MMEENKDGGKNKRGRRKKKIRGWPWDREE